ncbi:unnamed protein product [Staurois parvus]|uniref:Uncharacterized protein n=1 Tax=Staurois parvus TaxID=386267 RepID=A0ABN9C4S7_9NEOB|nr:unnamed protein product [Staurois parvus]
MTERGQRMLKHTERRSRRLSAESIAFRLAQHYVLEVCDPTTKCVIRSFFLLSGSQDTFNILDIPMQSVRCSGVKHAATGLYSSGDVFSGVTILCLTIQWTCLGLAFAKRKLLA